MPAKTRERHYVWSKCVVQSSGVAVCLWLIDEGKATIHRTVALARVLGEVGKSIRVKADVR